MKTVLFVPGFREDLSDRNYKSVIQAIESKDYRVCFLPIKWSRTTLNHWLKEVETEYARYDSNDVVLAGFSFGAITALMAATKKNPSELWLFSLSPYFQEDSPKKSRLKRIGKRRANAFSRLNFKKIAPKIKCKTLVFVGNNETNEIKKRAKSSSDSLKSVKLILVDNCKHDVSAPQYIKAIKKTIE